MKRFINKFDKRADIKTALADKKLNKPYVAYIIDEDVIDWNTQDTDIKALKFSTDDEALQTLQTDGSNIIEFSNDGATWTKYTTVGQLKFKKGMDLYIRVPEGVEYDKSVKIREVSATRYSVSGNINYLLKSDGNVDEYTASDTFSALFEDCTHLVDASKLELPTMRLAKYCYDNMFNNCTSLVNAPELPATTLAETCYYFMFYNCTSLVNAPELPATELSIFCYQTMFGGCTSLVNAPELPATTLALNCYNNMFNNCTSLVNAPELPATTLAEACYGGMFEGCSSLVNAPELPATTLANGCYNNMFNNCTSLVNAPELPATTLTENCYGGMFEGCTSLVDAPELPATTLAEECYSGMFEGCTSLVDAPELPATTLANGCYRNMFQGCTSLVNAPELPATTLTEWCYSRIFAECTSLKRIVCRALDYNDESFEMWVEGVPEGGTFVKEAGVDYPSGFSGIPDGWTVEEY